MKKKILGMIIIAVLVPVFVSGGMRCPNGDLIAEGTHKIRVLASCGEPISKEEIGYRWEQSSNYKQKLIIEQWTYDIEDGQYTILTIVAGKVEKIESVRK
jgi:hypothetical protein